MNKYVIICAVIVLGLLVGTIKVITKENKKLKDQIELLDNNNYAYEQDIISLQDSINRERGVYTLTIKELKNSQNNILKELDDTRKELKIKDKELEQMTHFNATIKTDTVISITNIINDSCEFNLNIEYNPQTIFKVSNTKINGKDSLRHSSDISASFNAYLYTKSS
jgi:flagellar biosynthesis regulator FlaF